MNCVEVKGVIREEIDDGKAGGRAVHEADKRDGEGMTGGVKTERRRQDGEKQGE